jgi:hypothetical protein
MGILKGSVEIPDQIEAGGRLAREQIGRMVDEERRPRQAEDPSGPGHAGRSHQHR